MQQPSIGVIGLGYVGIPLGVGLARKFDRVVGYDIKKERIRELREGYDRTGEIPSEEMRLSTLELTDSSEDIRGLDIYIVTVPTPVDPWHRPDLGPVIGATKSLAPLLKKGSIVVYESTVYPGVTEDICLPLLAEGSGLEPHRDFKVAYSPERINPGDTKHRLETITKVVSGEDEETLERVAHIYETVVTAGVHRAPSIRVAEAAKVIENTQRDLNIALMNELAILFDRLDIRTADVLEAAGTKWNFLPFRPGLVGGHCIGVDPYYLTFKAEEVGYHPQVILAGRRINDGMGKIIVEKTVKLLCKAGRPVAGARVGILGITFKENVPDLRNSRIPDLVKELKEYGVTVLVADPLVSSEETLEEYGIPLENPREWQNLDGIILGVPHREYLGQGASFLAERLDPAGGVVVDVKSAYGPDDFGAPHFYWSL
ncbi:MAG TPA: nucleotide sugar dehydrogenase [Synergistaceae bacterium]|nr:nucleotide sugar dehydrogenase [Synergistaceae bacterium]